MNIKKFIKKTIIVSLTLFVFLNLFGLFLDYQLRSTNLFKVNVLFNKKLPKNIILGSSRSLTGINTNLLSKLTKNQWYNLSMDDTKTETHLLFIKLLINLNKTPQNILLQYDRQNSQVDSITFFDNDYQLLPFINSNLLIDDYFHSKSGYFLFKYLPIFKYIYFNTELLYPGILTFFRPNYCHRFNENSGDYNYPENYLLKDSAIQFENRQIVLENSMIQHSIILCNKNKIDLYIYTAPIFHVKVTTDTVLNNYFDFSGIYMNADRFSDDFHIAHNTKDDFTLKLSKIFKVIY
jgi:hypothetical protein